MRDFSLWKHQLLLGKHQKVLAHYLPSLTPLAKRSFLLSSLLAGMMTAALAAPPELTTASSVPRSLSAVPRTRGPGTGEEKLDTNLRLLVRKYQTTRGGNSDGLTLQAGELENLFGIQSATKNPVIEVGIKTSKKVGKEALEKAGARVHIQTESLIFAGVPAKSLLAIAQTEGVESIQGVRIPHLPQPPRQAGQLVKAASHATIRGSTTELIDRERYTGKGVIVSIVDTGIDWKHPDFIREDGTSRVLYLYDMTDQSWETSNGKIGIRPPLEFNDQRPMGTLYSNEQINAALNGSGKVNSLDTCGHGTACAGIAAGNGRATANGVPAGTYMGLAPEADLIIVRAGESSFHLPYHLAVNWVVDKAKELKRPVVINLSLGTQATAHDGNTAEEQLLNSLCDSKGVAVCVAAGNERGDSFHAGGYFGAQREGQQDVFSSIAELFVSKETYLTSYFSPDDDWAMAIVGRDQFMVDPIRRKPISYFIWKEGSRLFRVAAEPGGKPYSGPLGFGSNLDYAKFFMTSVEISPDLSEMFIRLPAGQYYLYTYGATENVSKGRFDFYLPDASTASFGKGNEPRFMVGTPGTAKNVITVGAYDYQPEWQNLKGTFSYYNLPVGEISAYSNPGYSRDGSVKPDIAAPATYAISSLARIDDSTYCQMGRVGGSNQPNVAKISRDGYHIAWSGTSAAAPYVTGVVALILQKNPQLNCQKIKEIICKTSKKDDMTGGVPNRDWGYGKIDPGAALRITREPIAKAD